MKPQKVFLAALFLSSSFFLMGCETLNTLLGDINIVSVEQEKEIGATVDQEIRKTLPVADDPVLTPRIRSIGRRLAAGLPLKEFDYQFFIVKDKTPNAFTIPGGKIYVHTGLIDLAQSDDEIAGVIGHEIGHAYKRHPGKSLTRAYGAEYLSQLIFKDPSNKLGQIALQYAKGGLLARYSRQDEYEADEVGYSLIRKAGYNTAGLVTFLKRIQALESGGRTPLDFLRSHPPTPDRIARLESMQ